MGNNIFEDYVNSLDTPDDDRLQKALSAVQEATTALERLAEAANQVANLLEGLSPTGRIS